MRPYSFVSSFGRSCRLGLDMLAIRRNARSIHTIVLRLTDDKNYCMRRLAQAQLDIRGIEIDIENYASRGQSVLVEACRDDRKRLERHATRIMTLRNLANHVIRMLVEQVIGTDLLSTLERYTQMPMIHYSSSRLNGIICSMEKRCALTQQQSDEFRTLLKDIDSIETEEDELETSFLEKDKEVSERLSTIRQAPAVPSEDLVRLGAKPPSRL